MAIVTFDKLYLTDTLGLPDSDLVQHDEIVCTARWSIIHEIVFKDPATGKFYQVEYSEGATEYQDDEQPWENEGEVEVTEVELRSVTVEKWLPVQ